MMQRKNISRLFKNQPNTINILNHCFKTIIDNYQMIDLNEYSLYNVKQILINENLYETDIHDNHKKLLSLLYLKLNRLTMTNINHIFMRTFVVFHKKYGPNLKQPKKNILKISFSPRQNLRKLHHEN
jgi:hypothetical protein